MRLVNQSFKVLKFPKTLVNDMEVAGRTCYKSESKISEESAESFVRTLIKSGHHAMIEFGDITVRIITNRGVSHEWARHRLISMAQESSRYCVAGDSKLSFSNPRVNMTISELYNNKQNSINGAWKRFKIRQVDERTGDIIYSKIKNIHYIGEKPTLIAKTKLGYSIQTTPDHLIKTDEGYKRADTLLNRKIATNGTTELYKNKDWLFDQYNTLQKTSVDIAKEYNFNVSTIKKWVVKHELPRKPKSYFNKGKVPWNKGLSEKDDTRILNQANALRKYHWEGGTCKSSNGVRKDRIRKLSIRTYNKTVEGECSICNTKDKNLCVHHIDSCRDNNHKQNLITVCNSCHMGIHNKTNKVVYYDDVISVMDGGVISVYDIEMEQPNNNFIANGVCVHNCNYKNKDMEFIRPVWEMSIDEKSHFIRACQQAEMNYKMMMTKFNWTPQQAREVLPNSLKTEFVCKCNIREWRYLLDLRCSKQAHPQFRALALGILKEFHRRSPVLFEDILEKHVELGD